MNQVNDDINVLYFENAIEINEKNISNKKEMNK